MSNKWDKWYYYKSEPKAPETGTYVDRSWSWIGFGLYTFGCTFSASVAIVCWQIYQYFRYGIWPDLTVIDILHEFKNSWSFHPNDWLGVYQMLNSFPFSLFVFLAGLIVLVLAIRVDVSLFRGASNVSRDQTSIGRERARKRRMGYTDNEIDS